MRPPLLLWCLLVLCCSAPCRSEFMVLGGPRLQLNVGSECSALLQENLQMDLQRELQALRAAGVSHYRVFLSTEAVHSQGALSCLQTLLLTVTRAGLQPVPLLDLSWLSGPGAVFPGSGGGPDPVLRWSSSGSGGRGLDVLFAELGGLAHTWVLLLDGTSPDELQTFTQVQQIFRRHFPDPGHRVSLGLKSDLSSLTSDLSDLPMDFLSVKLSLDCDQEEEFEAAVWNMKNVVRDVPVLIYDTESKHCIEPQQLLLGNIIRAQMNSELNIIGCDAVAMLDLNAEDSDSSESEQQRRLGGSGGEDTPLWSGPVSFSPALKKMNASEVPSKSLVVWEKFSPWTEFQSRMYHYGTFPPDFLWGVMSAAYQIEGGWEADGKAASIWDTFTHLIPSTIPEYATGDVACDSYNLLEQDLNLIQALGVKSYRFSISWPRLFPNGTTAEPNPKGVDYYERLVDGLLKLNVTPMVTLYHWDLPQALQDVGGWENASIIQHFDAYADFCFKTFGDRVKFWITFNDPFTIAWKGYGSGEMPPNLKANPGVAPYQVGHNLLLAHATAYHTYQKYRPTQQGLVSIALNGDWYEPLDVKVQRELEAVDRAMQFRLGWFAHPIFKNGDYPEAMKLQVGTKSDLQRLKESRLPTFTEDEKKLILGSADVFCLNHHTTKTAKYSTQLLTPHSYQYDWDAVEEELVQFPQTGIQGPRAVPWGLRRVLNWIKEEYGNPEVYVTDNAVGTERLMGTDDFIRVFFLKSYIDEALKAQSLDGVQLRGYVGAPLMDGFEWLQGYIMGTGLNSVNFSDTAKTRTEKYSTKFYMDIVKNNGFPPGPDDTLQHGHFRDDMIWGTSTAAFQIEGGWRADGKGLSIWDTFSHTPDKVKNGDNGDVACDSYNRIQEDVEQLKMLGVKHYRFSISWPRVLPDGTTAHVNEAGVQYYERLVEALLQAGIQPLITLYHWDLPQALQDVGGWENVSIVDRFRDYADLMFSRLGPKVKRWITFNEPWIVAVLGYGYGNFAPGVSSDPGRKPYVVTHHILKSHAEAWHRYDQQYRKTQGGTISITINYDWAEPRNPHKQEDIDAADRHRQFFLGWYAHPIFVGDYPPLMKTVVRERSLAAGLPESRLPEFTPEEVQRIKGTHDFFGLNHYMSVLTFPGDFGSEQSYDADRGSWTTSDWTWLETGSSWLKVTPFGIRRLLKFIKDNYGNPPVIITENGVSYSGAVELNDTLRQYFYTEFINQVLKAHLLDGVDVRGYTAWSVMDNFEWASGYTERFGLFYVNRSDPTLPRTPKVSVQTYNRIIRCNGFPDPSSGHPCLQPVTTTTTAPSTGPPVAPTTGLSVSFLGLQLSAEDAAVGLNTTFALLVVACVAALLAGVAWFVFRRRRGKKSRF